MKHRIVPMAIVLLELGATQAQAQTTGTTTETKPAETEAATKEKKTERIEVTGSRIRRIDVETSAPVQVIDKKEIEQSGVVSLGDLFRKSASSSPTGNFSGSSNFVSAGAATLDLLGLGGSRTLVLLNGKRMPSIGGLDSVNIDNIPVGIIDRIEILSGGASAIYGADAVGGVVNIITRKEFSGTEASFFKSFTQHEGGDELEMTVAQGISLGADGNVILSAGYRKRNRIDKRDRDLAYSSPERASSVSRQPPGTWSYQPITITASGAPVFGDWHPSSTCPPESQVATVPTEPNNVYCTGLRKEAFVELIPEKNDWYVAATASYTLPSDWTVSGLLSYANSVNESDDGQFLPYAVDPLTNAPILLTNERARALGVIPETETADLFYVYAPMPNFPNRTYINTYNTWTAAAYLDGQVGEWKSSAGLSYATSQTIRRGEKIFNREEMSSIFVNPDTGNGEDPAYIPLDPNRDDSLLLNTFADLKSELNNQSSSVDVFFSRDLFELPGGAFSLGFGGALAAESFKLDPDDRDTQFDSTNRPLYAGTFADRGDGSRSITSAYTEFFAPVLADLDVEGAVRFDHYSDFDSTVNFGLGVKYSVLPFLGIRGRAASSYTAPQLSALHQVGGGGYFSVTDAKWCERENNEGRTCEMTNPVRQVYVDQPGNKDLEPEVGLNYIAGIILDPVPGLSLIADYYWVNLKKTFNTDEVQEIVDAWYAANPTATTGGTIKENPVELDEDGIISKVGLPIRNLGRLEVRAVDTKLSYTTELGGLRFGIDSQYFRMLSYKEQEVQDDPLREQVGYFSVPPWRWNNKLTVTAKTQDFTLQSRTIAPQKQDPETADADSLESKVGVYTEYDFVYGVDLPWNGSLQLGVNNIFDTIGGVEEGNALRTQDLATTSLYSYVGRAYYFRVTQRL